MAEATSEGDDKADRVEGDDSEDDLIDINDDNEDGRVKSDWEVTGNENVDEEWRMQGEAEVN